MMIRSRIQLNLALALAGILAIAAISLFSLARVMKADSLHWTKAIVESATSIVRRYQQQEAKGQLSREAAQTQAMAALGSIRYDGSNYVFVMGNHDRMVMHPIKPELVGKDLESIKDQQGNPFFARLYQGAMADGATTVAYVWPKPGSAKQVPKISYALSIPEWDWAIGSGVYLDDVEAELIHESIVLGSIALLVLVVVGIVSFYSSRAVGAVVALSSDELGALAQGELERPIAGADRSDEVGVIAKALLSLQDSLRDKARLEAEAVRHQDEVKERLRSAEEAFERATRHQSQALHELRGGLGHLADGRLSDQMKTPLHDDYEGLRSDFNQAAGRLADTMREVAQGATGIRRDAGEISEAAGDLSRRTDRQAQSLVTSTQVLGQVTSSVRKTAESAAQARQLTLEANGSAEQSAKVIEAAAEAMAGIKTVSQEIGQIVGVIDEIAFQTNLLALNAGVEAARAGEAGTGFAVVAMEVRALAQRCATAARQIRTLVASSGQQVDAGVSHVNQAVEVLHRILADIGSITAAVDEIAVSTKEQWSGLDSVNAAVGEMEQLTQQNVTMVKESSTATQALFSRTEALQALIARFDLGTGGRLNQTNVVKVRRTG